MDAPTTAMSTIKPRLSASAVTVAAVRRGARPADCRAKAPGTPASNSGRPRNRETHGVTTGPSRTRATITATAPTVTSGIEPSPIEPNTKAGMAAAADSAPTTERVRPTPLAASDEEARSASTGATRAARRAAPKAANRVTPTPTARVIATVRPVTSSPESVTATPKPATTARRPVGREDPGGQAEQPADQADSQGLSHDRGEHLTTCRPGGPEKGELPQALCHHDREGVGDQERTDQQRSASEDEQRDLDVLQLRLGRISAGCGGVLSEGDVDIAAECSLDAVGEDRRRYAFRRDNADFRGAVSESEESAGCGRVDECDRAGGQSVSIAEADEPDDGERLGGIGSELHLVADPDVVRAGGRLVDHDLIGIVGRSTGPQRIGADGRRRPRREHRWAGRHDRVVVHGDQAAATDLGVRLGDPGDRGHAGQHLRGQWIALDLHAHGGVEGDSVADGQVHPGGGCPELVVESSL